MNDVVVVERSVINLFANHSDFDKSLLIISIFLISSLLQFVAMIITLNVVSFGYLMLSLIDAEHVERHLACQSAVIASNVVIIRTMILTCSCPKLVVLAIVVTRQ